jgi:hypothetical protein
VRGSAPHKKLSLSLRRSARGEESEAEVKEVEVDEESEAEVKEVEVEERGERQRAL